MTAKRAVASDDEVRPTIADDDGLLCPVEFLETQPSLKNGKKLNLHCSGLFAHLSSGPILDADVALQAVAVTGSAAYGYSDALLVFMTGV